MRTIPTTEALMLEPNRTYPGAYIVTIKCPYCDHHHRHGLPGFDPTTEGTGHRVPHCHTPNMHTPNHHGYFIAVPDHLMPQPEHTTTS